MRHTMLVMVTLDIGSSSIHDVQQSVLEKFPEKFGKVEVFDTRIVGGLVDEDDIPMRSENFDTALKLLGVGNERYWRSKARFSLKNEQEKIALNKSQ